MKEGKYKCSRDIWDLKHRCRVGAYSNKLYTCEAEGDDETYTKESKSEEVENP